MTKIKTTTGRIVINEEGHDYYPLLECIPIKYPIYCVCGFLDRDEPWILHDYTFYMN